jgi:YhcH/YjgK/YiaL family protein
MIFDSIQNWKQYACLGSRFERAFRFLAESDPAAVACGKHDIVPGEVWVNIREYDVAEGGEAKLEAHRRFADIQYVFQGAEVVGWAVTGEGEITDPYNPETDNVFFKGDFERLQLSAGKFAVFFPGDAHAVRLAPPGGSFVKKAVAKVLLD